MTRPIFALAALALLALAGCANPGVSSKVDAAVVALTTAENVALVYTRLPRCPAPGPCSDQATVDRIKSADMQAYQAVKAAEQNEALLSVALQAVASLQAVVPVTR